jgi:hypothetical protein
MRNEPEGRGTYEDLLRKVPEGDGSGRKLGEGTGSVKKYLATTMGRGLDMRSLIEKEELAVWQGKCKSEYPVAATRP